MDADTRHQLKQNELAEALGRLRDLREPKYLYTLIGVLAVLVIAVAWYGWRASRRHSQEITSQRLNQIAMALESGDPTQLVGAQADLRAFIDENTSREGTALARLLLARALYDEAITNRERRPAGFEEAAVVLEQLRDDPKASPSVAASASYLLGSTYESLRQFDKARAVWESIANEPAYVGVPFKDMAAQRLADIDQLTQRIVFEPGSPPTPTPATPPPAPVDPSSVQLIPAAPIPEPSKPAEQAPAERAEQEQTAGQGEAEQPETPAEGQPAKQPQSAPSQSP